MVCKLKLNNEENDSNYRRWGQATQRMYSSTSSQGESHAFVQWNELGGNDNGVSDRPKRGTFQDEAVTPGETDNVGALTGGKPATGGGGGGGGDDGADRFVGVWCCAMAGVGGALSRSGRCHLTTCKGKP